MSTFRRLSALLLASAVLIGIPYVLLWQLPWPQPDLSWESVVVHLRSFALPPGVPTALLIVVLWAVWGLYGAALGAEALARARGGGLRFRPLGPIQVVAATALGATVAAPASALADTVQVQDVEPGTQTDDESPPDTRGREDTPDGAPQTPAADSEWTAERSRTVAGFAFESAALSDPMRQDLDGVADMVRDFGRTGAPVRISGHTDPSGPDAVNRELSRERAESAADYLRQRLGDDAPEIETEGAGSRQQRDGDAQAQRRIEIAYEVAAVGGNGGADAAGTQAPQDGAEGAGDSVGRNQDAPAGGDHGAGGGGEPGADAQAAGGGDTADAASAAGAPAGAAAANGQDTGEQAGGEAAGDGTAPAQSTPVVMVEVPDAATAGALAVAGIVGGYAAGRRGSGVPRLRLTLPKLRRSPGDSERRALPPIPPRPEPAPDIDERVTVELDHVPGIGLTGPGARAAARRLVVNALGDPAERPARVIMTSTYAVQLLGPEAYGVLQAHPCAPVRLTDSMEEALTELQRELHDRAADPGTPSEGQPLVLLTDNDARHETALSGLLLHGRRSGITAVLTGRWPLGGSCHVSADGLITETSPPLSTLHHASWPGSQQSEVAAAVRAYRHAQPAQRATASTPPAPRALDAPFAEATEAAADEAAAASAAPSALQEPERLEADRQAAQQDAAQKDAAAERDSQAEEPAAPAKPAKAGKARAAGARAAADGHRERQRRTERVTDLSGFTAALAPGGRPGGTAGAGDGTEAVAGAGAEHAGSGAAAESGGGVSGTAAPAEGADAGVVGAGSKNAGAAAAAGADEAPDTAKASSGIPADTAGVADTAAPRVADASGQPAEAAARSSASGAAEDAADRGADVQRTPAGPVSRLPRKGAAPSGDAARGAEPAAPEEAADESSAVVDGAGSAERPSHGNGAGPGPDRAGPGAAVPVGPVSRLPRRDAPAPPAAGAAAAADDAAEAGSAAGGGDDRPQEPEESAQPLRPARPGGGAEQDPSGTRGSGGAGKRAQDPSGTSGRGAAGKRAQDATARAARVRRMRLAKSGGAAHDQTAAAGAASGDGATAAEASAHIETDTGPDAGPGTGTAASAAASLPADPGEGARPARRSDSDRTRRDGSGGGGASPRPPAAEASAEAADAPEQPDGAVRQDPEAAEDGSTTGNEAEMQRLPRKPRKAGRGRNWRPRETT
ncbi:OmpA family protein [Streptomonospora wellingtoniae]|uniref:OmpA family protein n=1 Tax=Streptomonospora wellingtoniae TaxID=3075544 RepID=A0ABU2KWF8_9ACTN|nr:OmpA family protein [Streptomonospora sp. DSM 45055]MDT0303624.1 OmpA family protein [Streptomonospora sp. DSM 45055]